MVLHNKNNFEDHGGLKVIFTRTTSVVCLREIIGCWWSKWEQMIVLLPCQELYSDVFGSIEGGRTDWNIKPLIDYVLLCDGLRFLNCSQCHPRWWSIREYDVQGHLKSSNESTVLSQLCFIRNYGPWTRPAIGSPVGIPVGSWDVC